MSVQQSIECLIGFKCRDFVMLAVDQMEWAYGLIIMKDDQVKIHKLSDDLLMGMIGDQAGIYNFSQFITKNLDLYKMKNKYQLDYSAIVHFTRSNINEGWRNGSPHMINFLAAGCDKVNGPKLYYIDALGTSMEIPSFAAHGFGGLICWGVLEHFYRSDLQEFEAYQMVKMCVSEVQQRFVVNLPNFHVQSISANGIKTWPLIRQLSTN